MTPPLPSPQSFERLQIADGLLMTADRWRRAHNYHRQRQNFYYQALQQPGIVWGLGVALIPAPAEIEARFRDRRWVQIQPGVAIDCWGNPIIVPRPEVFRIESSPGDGERQRVFLVISYVDPDDLRHANGREQMQETFRIVETTQPKEGDVELCRLELVGGNAQLQPPLDVFIPGPNRLDLRYRPHAQDRPLSQVQVVQIGQRQAEDRRITQNLTHLLNSVGVLFPRLQGVTPVPVMAPHDLVSGDVTVADLVYLPLAYGIELLPGAVATLRDYLRTGGMVLVTVSFADVKLADLQTIRRELQGAIAGLPQEGGSSAMRSQLQAEIQAIDNDMAQQIQAVIDVLIPLAKDLECPIQGTGDIHREHPLRLQPFLFAELPMVGQQSIYLRQWGGLVLMIGDLADNWGPNEQLSQSREAIRSAQEMGINLLYFAQRRRQLISLQQPLEVDTAPTAPQSLADRVLGS